MERKIASVQVIDALAPIEGADNILRARVMGWDVVVKKSEFSVGDRCVFFEIDARLPDGPAWAEQMRARGFRVKTAKLRGVLSQGLALPVAILPEGAEPAVGDDVAALLGVGKYEPFVPDAPHVKGNFPAEVPKTDEIRLQSALGLLDEIRGHDFVITTKLDGRSTTIFRRSEDELLVCSRNYVLADEPQNPAWRLAHELGLAHKLPVGLAVQAELCGPGIQKNRLGLAGPALFVYSLYDAGTGAFRPHREMVSLCAELGLATVPVEGIFEGEAAQGFDHSLAHYLERAKGRYAGTQSRKEGIVVRPLATVRSPHLQGRLSFKVISNEFLLKEED